MRRFIHLLNKIKKIDKFELEFDLKDQVEFTVCDDEFFKILKEFNILILKDKYLQRYLKNIALICNLQTILDYLKSEKFINFWFNVIDYNCFLPWDGEIPELLANKIYSLLQAFVIMMLFFNENDPEIKSRYLDLFKDKASDIPAAVTLWFYWNESLVCEDLGYFLDSDVIKVLNEPTEWSLVLEKLTNQLKGL